MFRGTAKAQRLPPNERHPFPPLHPATRASLIEVARRLDPLVLRWGKVALAIAATGAAADDEMLRAIVPGFTIRRQR